jgi:hypothetical protein
MGCHDALRSDQASSDWTKRLRRGMGGAVFLSRTDWQEIEHRRILI